MARTGRFALGTVGAGVLAFLAVGLSRTTNCWPSVHPSSISLGAVRKGLLPHDLFGARIPSALHNGLYVERPTSVEAQCTKGVFRVEPSGEALMYVAVKFGRASANTIEVLDGLKEGDKIVVSDMSAWDQFDRIRLR